MILLVLIANGFSCSKRQNKNDLCRCYSDFWLLTSFHSKHLRFQTGALWRRFLGELFFIGGIQNKPVSSTNRLIQVEMVPDHQGLNRNVQALGNP